MASIVAANQLINPSVSPSTFRSSPSVHPAAGSLFSKPSDWSKKTVQNVSRVTCMQTVNPLTNQRFETLSYVPPLSSDSIAKEIDYMISKGWIPCLEFDKGGHIFRENSRMPGYYDGRYWTLWKLPMFGCNDPAQVLREIDECKKVYPNCYIRMLGFDTKKQTQCVAFIVHRPT